MSIPNQDIEQMVEDAVADAENEVSGRDRTRGKTMYTRKALVKVFRMTAAELAAYEPKNGFEEAAVAHRKRCLKETGIGTAALLALRNTLGEATSVQKESASDSKNAAVEIVDDLPRALRKQVN